MQINCSVINDGWIRADIVSIDTSISLRKLKNKVPVWLYDNKLRCYKTTVFDFDRLIKVCSDEQIELRATDKVCRYIEWYKCYLSGYKNIELNLSLWNDNKNLQLQPHQVESIKKCIHFRKFIIASDMGTGKSLSDSTKVLTDSGWNSIGNCKINDRVYGRDGKLYGITGVYPQGELHTFKINFTDNTSIECCKDHLWAVRNRNINYEVLTLEQLIGLGFNEADGTCRWQIPLAEPISFSRKNVPIEPYMMGVLLAAGVLSLTTPRISIKFADCTVIDKINKNCSYSISNLVAYRGNHRFYVRRINNIISDLKLNFPSEDKFIPQCYLFSEYNQRLELLNGIMDSRGICKKETDNLRAMSKQMASDIAHLVRSLGGICSVREKLGFTRKDNRYFLKIQTKFCPYSIGTKRKIWKEYSYERVLTPIKEIKSVEYAGVKSCTCISIDSSDQLYIAEDFIVTHNTIQGMALVSHCFASQLANRALIVVPKKIMKQWKTEFLRFTNIDESDINVFGESRWKCRIGQMKKFGKRSKTCLNCHFQSECSEEYNQTQMQLRLNQIYTSKVLIINYDMVSSHKSDIERSKFNIIILDEASRVKNIRSEVTKSITKITKKLDFKDYVILMSGTIIENKLEELFSAVNIVSDKIFGNYWNYKERYVITDFFGTGIGYKLKDEIKQKIDHIHIRKTLSEVWNDRPMLWLDNKSCEMSKYQRKIYNDCRKGILKEIEDKSKAKRINMMDIAPKIQILLTVCGTTKSIDSNNNHPDHSTKIEMLKMLIDDCSNCNTILVFSRFSNRCSPYIIEELNQGKRKVFSVNGKTKNIQLILDDVQKNPGCILVAGDSIAYGMNLQYINYMINFDLPWNPAVLHQRIRRIFRPGQTKNVSIVNLITENTVEQLVYGKIVSKQLLFSDIFNVSKDLKPLMPSVDDIVNYLKD